MSINTNIQRYKKPYNKPQFVKYIPESQVYTSVAELIPPWLKIK